MMSGTFFAFVVHQGGQQVQGDALQLGIARAAAHALQDRANVQWGDRQLAHPWLSSQACVVRGCLREKDMVCSTRKWQRTESGSQLREARKTAAS